MTAIPAITYSDAGQLHTRTAMLQGVGEDRGDLALLFLLEEWHTAHLFDRGQ